MFNTIFNLSSINSKVGSNSYYNNTLPISLEVIDRNYNRYKVKLGNKIILAYSNNLLEIGKKYWADVSEYNGEVIISNLNAQPEIFQLSKQSSLKYKMQIIKDILEKKYIVQNLRSDIISAISHVQSKDDFIFLANSLLALSRGIINIVINEEKKDILIQIRKVNNVSQFSVIFPNLGLINGICSIKHITISSPYHSVLRALSKKSKLFMNEKRISLIKDSNIKPIFELECGSVNIEA